MGIHATRSGMSGFAGKIPVTWLTNTEEGMRTLEEEYTQSTPIGQRILRNARTVQRISAEEFDELRAAIEETVADPHTACGFHRCTEPAQNGERLCKEHLYHALWCRQTVAEIANSKV